MRKYEGMFLFDPTVSADWDAIQEELRRLFDRAEAKLILCTKWDERRLAYEINGRKRAIYALTFFEADPTKMTALERDAQLSESVMRVLIVRADHLSEEEMKEIAARPAEQPGDSDRGDRGERGERGDRGGRDREHGRGGRDFGRGRRREEAGERVEAGHGGGRRRHGSEEAGGSDG